MRLGIWAIKKSMGGIFLQARGHGESNSAPARWGISCLVEEMLTAQGLGHFVIPQPILAKNCLTKGLPGLEGRRFGLERLVMGLVLALGSKHPLAGWLVKCHPCSP